MITLVSKLCLEALFLVPFTQPLLLDDYLVYASPVLGSWDAEGFVTILGSRSSKCKSSEVCLRHSSKVASK